MYTTTVMVGLALHSTGAALQMQLTWSNSIWDIAIQGNCDQETEASCSGCRREGVPMWSKAAKGNLCTTKGRVWLILRAQGQLISVLEEQSTVFARLS